jgi:RNA recognition motif-containing protein
VSLTGAPHFGFDQNKNTLFIKQIPRHISRLELKEIFSQLEGLQSFSLSEANKSKDYAR